jgi:hypothetical protein
MQLSTKTCQRVASVVLLVALAAFIGCEDPYTTQERYDQGLVLLLPGIEGVGGNVWNLQRGLDEGGVPYALQIYPWGFPVPGFGMLVNQTDVSANRAAGARLAQVIRQYQAQYPGRPVFVAGHSGGGGVSVFAAESLSARSDTPVEGIFLLSASLSANYPLGTALASTKRGIVNVYNPNDTGLLGVGTGVFGNVDGGTGDSCGRTGLYTSDPRVFEINIGPEQGVLDDPHSLVVQPWLVKRTIAPWILAETWPPRWQVAPPR